MNVHLATGKLRYTKNWLILDADDPYIAHYYQALLPKYLYVRRPRYPAHITVMRPEYEQPENLDFWGKHQGRKIEFFYSPIVQNSETYYWLNCFSTELEEIRAELGLYVDDRYNTPPEGFRKCFHMTIGNCKELDHEKTL